MVSGELRVGLGRGRGTAEPTVPDPFGVFGVKRRQSPSLSTRVTAVLLTLLTELSFGVNLRLSERRS